MKKFIIAVVLVFGSALLGYRLINRQIDVCSYVYRSDEICEPVGLDASREWPEPTDWVEQNNYLDSADNDVLGGLFNYVGDVDEVNDDVEKVRLIANYVLQNLDDKRGYAVEQEEYKYTKSRFEDIIEGKRKVWCVDFARVYAMFANNWDVPTRVVHVRSKNDGEVLLHALAESYIEDLDKWIMVDLTYRQMMVNDEEGNPLSVYDFLKEVDDGGAVTAHLAGDVEEEGDRSDEEGEQQAYFGSQTRLVYYLPTEDYQQYVLELL